MKVIVTGGAGFIGSHLVDELIVKGFEVHVIDNLLSGKKQNLHPSAAFHNVDVRSKEAHDVIVSEKPGIVFHLAAQADVEKSIRDPKYDADLNINGTINILKACHAASVKKFVFASTSGVYGDLKKMEISEDDPAVPISYYGLSKLTAESYIRLFHKLYELTYTILRYGNVYGPRQSAKGEGGVVAIFLDRIKNEMPLTIHGDGEQTRDFIFVKDIVRANIAAMEYGDQETIHVSTSQRTSVNALLEMMKIIHGSPVHATYAASRIGDIKHSCLSNLKGKQVLAWNPIFTIFDGLTETYHYKNNT
ncbi:NAD-dependent epimerase/dehydratase family protein [Metabacillus idriensis]|uniref:NAD-dependent epimerase/dehydratase family protein n=1 Tax=Metabacillus idriensis TaxID=324768 RepID=UPI00174B3687|nr:NAD-dependent epimerase/dehydratase family protein [Metabacillus idriensis]